MKTDNNINIIVLEDNFGDFFLLKEYIEECLEQVNIENLIRFIELQEIANTISNYDYIFLDMSLPDKSGEELIKEVIKIAKNVPVIMLTGFSSEAFSKKAIELGVKEYLLKDELNSSALQNKVFFNEGIALSMH
ncbi:response regulator [Flavobacterium sp.]|uniref:response regulator n=1 Tax=Flavobacterium sp. TaxID=239 RepID=UPI0040484E89